MSTLPTMRVATDADAAAVATFLRENFIIAYGHCSTPDNIGRHVSAAFSTERLAHEIASPNYLNLLAIAGDGAVVGVAQLGFASKTPPCVAEPAVEMRRFYDAPEWHGRGLADALMAAAVELAIPRGKALWLSVWEEAPRAVGFYRRVGFNVAGTTTFVIGDDAKVDWVMCRRLSA